MESAVEVGNAVIYVHVDPGTTSVICTITTATLTLATNASLGAGATATYAVDGYPPNPTNHQPGARRTPNSSLKDFDGDHEPLGQPDQEGVAANADSVVAPRQRSRPGRYSMFTPRSSRGRDSRPRQNPHFRTSEGSAALGAYRRRPLLRTTFITPAMRSATLDPITITAATCAAPRLWSLNTTTANTRPKKPMVIKIEPTPPGCGGIRTSIRTSIIRQILKLWARASKRILLGACRSERRDSLDTEFTLRHGQGASAGCLNRPADESPFFLASSPSQTKS